MPQAPSHARFHPGTTVLLVGSLVGCAVVASSLPGQAQPPGSPTQSSTPADLQQQAADVARLLEGVMDTTAQAKANPKAPSVRMTTCRVQAPEATLNAISSVRPVIVLYQEQALTTKLNHPYRQRWLVITPNPRDRSIESRSFKPSQASFVAGLCSQPADQRRVPSSDLGSPVCTVVLHKSASGYHGETPAAGCPANIRGAVRITNQIDLFPGGMNTWDRGFDANGNQVWGAASEAYQFRRP